MIFNFHTKFYVRSKTNFLRMEMRERGEVGEEGCPGRYIACFMLFVRNELMTIKNNIVVVVVVVVEYIRQSTTAVLERLSWMRAHRFLVFIFKRIVTPALRFREWRGVIFRQLQRFIHLFFFSYDEFPWFISEVIWLTKMYCSDRQRWPIASFWQI